MPPKCSICRHPNRVEIDAALIARQSLRDIARQFATSKDSLARHGEHIPKSLAMAKQAEVVASAETLLEQTHNLLARATRLADKAEHAKNLSAALQGVREIRGVLELLGKVSGELKTSQTNVGIAVQQAIEIDTGDPAENERRIAELLNEAGLVLVPLEPPVYQVPETLEGALR